MFNKNSMLTVLLGSSVVSALVSIMYNHNFVSKKDLLARELNFVNMMNVVLEKQKDRDETGKLLFVSKVLEPMFREDDKYRGIVLSFLKVSEQTQSTADEQKREATLTEVTTVLTSPDVANALQKSGAIPSEYSVDELRKGLFSGNRRQLSDQLVGLIDKKEKDITPQLLKSIIDDDTARQYRVNLYIAFTLARVNSWTASPDLIEKFNSLTKTQNYSDPTFKKHVDAALTKLKNT